LKIGKFRVSKKAVSPVIATLLMIAVAVAASVIVYVWSAGLLGTLMGGGGSQVKEQLIIEAYNWNNPASLVLSIRNVGSASVTIDKIYVAGSSMGFSPPAASVPVGTVVSVTVTITGIAGYGVAYPIKVVTQTGGVFSFSAILGSTG